jgi:hypothetical protein
VSRNQWYLKKFVETNKDFGEQKFALNELFVKHSHIGKIVEDYLRTTMWHNLPKVQTFYLSTLGIKFPPVKDLYKAVAIRHDIIHRSGKTKDGTEHTITKRQVQNLLAQSENLVAQIEEQWRKIEEADALEFFGLSDSDDDAES